MRAPLIAHIHVSKTSGTSFRSMLEKRFGSDHANLNVDDPLFVYPETEIEAFVAARPGLCSLSSHFIHTYPPRIAGREVLYVTFLRKPIEQFISYLTSTRKNQDKTLASGSLGCLPECAAEMPLCDIARWVLTHPGVPFHENYLVNYFAKYHYASVAGNGDDTQYKAARLTIAKTVLANFFLTGITERMEESVRRFQVLGERYGIQVPSGVVQVENVSSGFRDDLRWIHPDDEVGAMLMASIAEDQKLYDWAIARFEQQSFPAGVAAPSQSMPQPKTLPLVTQVFWRFDGAPFSEEHSVQRKWAIGPTTGRYSMRLPQFEAAPAELRLDITDQPALLRLNSVSLLNNRAEQLWSLDLENVHGLTMAGMSISPVESGSGALVKVEDNDPAILLPLDRAVLKHLRSGATLQIEMSDGRSGNAGVAPPVAAPPAPVLIPFTATTAPRLYLELLERCLTRLLVPDSCVDEQLEATGFFDPDARRDGKDWPSEAETMIGLKRLESLEACAASVLNEDVPGDFVEAGVWRGGASILLRGVLRVYGDTARCVWVADSFEGLPIPDVKKYPADEGKPLHIYNNYLTVPLEIVKRNFEKYGQLDNRVRFLKGWFKDSLPNAPIGRISLLRLDGDLYESTMDILRNLYDRVSPAGYVIVDDYGALECCKAAIHDFRKQNDITEPIVPIDWSGVYWRKRV
jgi:hypothetical protein